MAETKANTNVVIGTILGIVLLIVLTYAVGHSIGKKTKPADVPLPYDDNGNGNQNTQPQQSTAELTVLADKIYADLTSFAAGQFSFYRDDDSYQEALNLSNTGLTQLYNIFKNKYYSEYSQTLTAMLADDVNSFWQSQTQRMKALLTRLQSLNLV